MISITHAWQGALSRFTPSRVTIYSIFHLDRGFEKLEEKLSLFGATIERMSHRYLPQSNWLSRHPLQPGSIHGKMTLE